MDSKRVFIMLLIEYISVGASGTTFLLAVKVSCSPSTQFSFCSCEKNHIVTAVKKICVEGLGSRLGLMLRLHTRHKTSTRMTPTLGNMLGSQL